MIPILFSSDETDFDNHGLGDLVDATRCEVTEERNGQYELELDYPKTGALFSEITEERIVKAKPNDIDDPQLFRLYRSTKPIDGLVTFYGHHISYDLRK